MKWIIYRNSITVGIPITIFNYMCMGKHPCRLKGSPKWSLFYNKKIIEMEYRRDFYQLESKMETYSFKIKYNYQQLPYLTYLSWKYARFWFWTFINWNWRNDVNLLKFHLDLCATSKSIFLLHQVMRKRCTKYHHCRSSQTRCVCETLCP